MTLLSSAYLIDRASATVSASMALDLKKLFCFPQSGFHKSQSFFVFLLGILRKDLFLRCTKGNCKAFHLFGCGHWTYSIRAGPKGGFVKNGQSFYHAGWRLCPFFIFKARHPNCILTVWIPTAAENAGGFQRRAALRTHSSKATMASFGSISFSQLRRCAIALFAKRFVFIVSQSASRMISAVSFSKST